MFEKSDVLPRDIKYKVGVQTSKLVKNDTFQGMIFSSSLSVQAAHSAAAGYCEESHGYRVKGIHSDGYGQTCPAICAGTIESGNRQF